jgi:hypothetical protein
MMRSALQERLLKKLAREFPRLDDRPVGWMSGIFSIAQGFYRSSKYSDCCRWELYVSWVGDHMDGGITHKRFHLGSYNTMTDCAKRNTKLGIDKLRFHQFEIFIDDPSKKSIYEAEEYDHPPGITETAL